MGRAVRHNDRRFRERFRRNPRVMRRRRALAWARHYAPTRRAEALTRGVDNTAPYFHGSRENCLTRLLHRRSFDERAEFSRSPNCRTHNSACDWCLSKGFRARVSCLDLDCSRRCCSCASRGPSAMTSRPLQAQAAPRRRRSIIGRADRFVRRGGPAGAEDELGGCSASRSTQGHVGRAQPPGTAGSGPYGSDDTALGVRFDGKYIGGSARVFTVSATRTVRSTMRQPRVVDKDQFRRGFNRPDVVMNLGRRRRDAGPL